jgi:RNA polymerase sigma-70 factor (ECF subfamily)
MSAMDGLVEAQIPRLRRYARALTGDAVRADDLVQDTLERAWGRRHLWRAGTDLRAWLFTVMHNVFLNQRRSARPPTDFVELDDTLPLPARPDGVDAQLELRDVARALGQLPPEFREVLLLVALEEMSYEDVAKVLAIPVGTVMSRLSRSRERLRALTQGHAVPTLRRVK